MLVDAHNGFNELSHFAMLWTVQHHWPAGARFAFNFYRYWAQLLLRQPGELPVSILSRYVVPQRNPLPMLLCGITLTPRAEELSATDPGLISPFSADDAAFDGSTRRSAQLLELLMKRGLDQGDFPEPDKLLFISDTPVQEEELKW